MRLVDADALADWIIKELRWALYQKHGTFDNMTGRQAANVIRKRLDDAPTIDAIQVAWLDNKFLDIQNKDKALSRAAWLVLYAWQKEQEAR